MKAIGLSIYYSVFRMEIEYRYGKWENKLSIYFFSIFGICILQFETTVFLITHTTLSMHLGSYNYWALGSDTLAYPRAGPG